MLTIEWAGPALLGILIATFAWATGVFQWLWSLATWLFSGAPCFDTRLIQVYTLRCSTRALHVGECVRLGPGSGGGWQVLVSLPAEQGAPLLPRHPSKLKDN